jgi:glutathione S-transferase
MFAPHLAFFAFAPEGRAMLATCPTLDAWLDRMNARPSLLNTTAEKLNARAMQTASVEDGDAVMRG